MDGETQQRHRLDRHSCTIGARLAQDAVSRKSGRCVVSWIFGPAPMRRCLEDGKKLIRAHYGLSPAEYRTKWGLPSNYPMVAANYARQRSELAVKLGLGRGSAGRPELAKAA